MIIGKQLVVIARFGKLVAKFDQQPVFALAAAAIVETYQYPAAFELFTVKNEFEFAVTECLLGIFITERAPNNHDPTASRCRRRIGLSEWSLRNPHSRVGGLRLRPPASSR